MKEKKLSKGKQFTKTDMEKINQELSFGCVRVEKDERYGRPCIRIWQEVITLDKQFAEAVLRTKLPGSPSFDDWLKQFWAEVKKIEQETDDSVLSIVR
jgi:hypothetical protein